MEVTCYSTELSMRVIRIWKPLTGYGLHHREITANKKHIDELLDHLWDPQWIFSYM